MHQSDSARPDLPALPRLQIRVRRQLGEADAIRPYLRLCRLELSILSADGTESDPFHYDIVERTSLDAVVIVPHFVGADGRRNVVLRSAVRPPVALRPRDAWPVAERPTLGALWELPAGLVEVSERSEQGLRECAARELYEEIGAKIDPQALGTLGPSTFPAPGIIGERHFYFHARISPSELVTPAEDGSVLERGATLLTLSLEDALARVRTGEIEDSKTEIALRRLAETAL